MTNAAIDHEFLGRLAMKKFPSLCINLLSPYYKAPIETNLSRIPEYYIAFCKVQKNTLPQDLIGPLYKSDNVHIRRTFIAVILHIYAPHLLEQGVDDMALSRSGISTSLANLFHVSKQVVSKTIKEVVLWERQYEEFAESVSVTIEKLTNGLK